MQVQGGMPPHGGPGGPGPYGGGGPQHFGGNPGAQGPPNMQVRQTLSLTNNNVQTLFSSQRCKAQHSHSMGCADRLSTSATAPFSASVPASPSKGSNEPEEALGPRLVGYIVLGRPMVRLG
jgi:hypothetical protein